MLGRVIGGDALHRRDDDFAGPLLPLFARLAFDGLGQTDGVALRFLADGLEQLRLRLCCRHAADAFERRHVVLLGSGELLAAYLELALPIEQLAVALLEHVGAHVELLIASQEAALQNRQFGSFGAGLVFCLALQPQLLVFGCKDQFLLLCSRFGDDPSGLLLSRLDGLVGDNAASDEAHEHARNKGSHHDDGHKGGIHIHLPPTRSDDATGGT